MAESALITITDVRVYRQADSKFDTTRFNAFLTDVQRKNLRQLLGDTLYYDFMLDDRASGKYADLLNGKVYAVNGNNITYYGIKPVLVYWWLAMAVREGDLFHSQVGAIQLTNNTQQNYETAKEKEKIALGYMETAQEYANDAIQFLNANSTTYPLWIGDSEKNKTQFVSFKI